MEYEKPIGSNPKQTDSSEDRQEFDQIVGLFEEYKKTLAEAIKNGNLKDYEDKLDILKEVVEQRLAVLSERVYPFESLVKLEKQYDKQVEILKLSGLLSKNDKGEKGIKGIDRQFYPLPAYEDVKKAVFEGRLGGQVKLKEKQGFRKLLLVPLSRPLNVLYDSLVIRIFDYNLKSHSALTKFNIQDWVKKSDTNGHMLYGPKDFSLYGNLAKTKAELIDESKNSCFPGWRILLVEDLAVIPNLGEGKNLAGRKQPEVNKTPNEYLRLLATDNSYRFESPIYLEDWIMLFVSRIMEKNQLLDTHSSTLMLGSAIKNNGTLVIPSVLCTEAEDVFDLVTVKPDFNSPYFGMRTALQF